MFEYIQERRRAVEENILKSFSEDIDIEKGRAKKTFAVGDTFTRHGITYKCTGISVNTGRPTWSKVKDSDGGKQDQPEKKEKREEKSDNKFIPKHSFKNAKDMANKMNLYLDKNVSIQKFVDILGETVYDKGNGTNGRNLRVGSGMYGEWDSRSDSYLQKDMSGDYLEFKKKPSKEKLDECAKILKEQLAEEGYDVNPEFVVLPHNSYYQHSDTFGVGINIRVTKKEWQNSSKQEQPDKKEDKKEEKLSFEEVKDAISEYVNLESVKEGTIQYDRDTHLFIQKKYNSATKRYEAIVEDVNGRRASSKEDVEQVLRRYFDELKRQNKIKYNKDKGNKKQEKPKKEIKKEDSVKLTKKDKEEIENKINKFKFKGSNGWTEDENRLPYDFELGSLEDGAVNLYGYGKAYGDSKTITDEFTYNRGKQYTMWYRGQPSNYWYAEPKQQLANNLILWLKEKGVINEDNYKSFKVKMRIELD